MFAAFKKMFQSFVVVAVYYFYMPNWSIFGTLYDDIIVLTLYEMFLRAENRLFFQLTVTGFALVKFVNDVYWKKSSFAVRVLRKYWSI